MVIQRRYSFLIAPANFTSNFLNGFFQTFSSQASLTRQNALFGKAVREAILPFLKTKMTYINYSSMVTGFALVLDPEETKEYFEKMHREGMRADVSNLVICMTR